VISILLWMSGRSQELICMWITLAGNQISVNLLKAIFARARPELAYYSETSYSFPSGHSAVSAAFFGFLMYLVIRERLVPAGAAITVGILAILLIGMSRLVLDVHYVSDVVSGYLIGAVWALFGIWFAERGRLPDGMVPNLSRWGRTPELAVVVVGALVVTLLALYYQYNLVILPVQGLTP
jgi:membrane-associated phospholipid phosphatase